MLDHVGIKTTRALASLNSEFTPKGFANHHNQQVGWTLQTSVMWQLETSIRFVFSLCVCVCKPLDTRGFEPLPIILETKPWMCFFRNRRSLPIVLKPWICSFATFLETGGQRGWGGVSGQRRRPPPSCENVPVFFQNGKRLSQGPHNYAQCFN